MDPLTPTIVRRPFLSVQCDWDEVLREEGNTAWISCKEIENPSIHGKITADRSFQNNIYNVKISEGFQIHTISSECLVLSYGPLNNQCKFYAPSKVYSNIHSKGISHLDVTAELGVSVCLENKLYIWDISNGHVLRHLEGHVWDVYCCRFFPSGMVVLSAGADMQLKIWAADTGKCAATLVGHSAAITDTAIVDRGRNIVSVSKDGTARLWDCGTSSCLHVVSEENGTINCCSISTIDIDLGLPEHPPSEKEIGTCGKLLLLGTESGSLKGIGLRSHKKLFEFKCDSAINCLCFISPTTVAFGTQDGKIYLFDLRARLPVSIWEESASPVLCLIPIKNSVFCGRADGSSIFTAFDRDENIQLTGPGFDPVYTMAYNGSAIFTGSRDGCIRKYNIKL